MKIIISLIVGAPEDSPKLRESNHSIVGLIYVSLRASHTSTPMAHFAQSLARSIDRVLLYL